MISLDAFLDLPKHHDGGRNEVVRQNWTAS
jgi:hypothetical protein